jgi:hypothetical protein
VAIGQIGPRSGDGAGLNQGAELEIDGVHIAGAAGEMAEAAIGIAAPQDPLGGLIHRPADRLRIAAKLAQDEDGVEAGVDVPIRFLEVKTAVFQDVFASLCFAGQRRQGQQEAR